MKAGGEGGNRDEMVGWHHWLNGHEFEQAPEKDKGQGSQACCSPWGHKSWTQLATEQQQLAIYYPVQIKLG